MNTTMSARLLQRPARCNKRLTLLLRLLWLLLPATLSVNVQAQTGPLSPQRNGVLEEVMQDDGYLVISGQRLVYRRPDVKVFYGRREIRPSFLSPGQRVYYRTRNDGSLGEITVIGPDPELDRIDDQ